MFFSASALSGMKLPLGRLQSLPLTAGTFDLLRQRSANLSNADPTALDSTARHYNYVYAT
eukprot:IDg8759t1